VQVFQYLMQFFCRKSSRWIVHRIWHQLWSVPALQNPIISNLLWKIQSIGVGDGTDDVNIVGKRTELMLASAFWWLESKNNTSWWKI
jgi:hypothetical protein